VVQSSFKILICRIGRSGLLRARPTVEEKLSRFDWPLKTELAGDPVQKDVLFLELFRSVLRGPIMLTEIVYKLGTQRSP
jgi:hypothetical protein